MAHLYKASMWQGGSGYWYCGDIEDLGHDSGRWWIPARMLSISPSDYVRLLVEKFNVSVINFNYPRNFLYFAWKNEADCRKYKNWINAAARKANYYF